MKSLQLEQKNIKLQIRDFLCRKMYNVISFVNQDHLPKGVFLVIEFDVVGEYTYAEQGSSLNLLQNSITCQGIK